ncbi:hypothetical protein [Planctomyces sp. SH-PL62]|uniref:hypothetical protein n=1 Tax=Planctomyces sp. SH-PL62 TaxID=1636152 RepID=UPI00078B4073|nr:hypothetical protein [Planctomyces sp. SH-PL62]AMV38492.1 hypothetical protein VT85_13735 [Planctomyces sp. SH-PL62]
MVPTSSESFFAVGESLIFALAPLQPGEEPHDMHGDSIRIAETSEAASPGNQPGAPEAPHRLRMRRGSIASWLSAPTFGGSKRLTPVRAA